MRARIEQLPLVVANQIAAGEVIERPASVVKELLENAFDAHATMIQIEIDFGGLNQIRISDNGAGILAQDLVLAVSAHATSKIRQLNDLYSISSMGFRGEALASIASVSRLSISSRPQEQPHAAMICVEGIEMTQTPCARAQGTTVDVRDLFFNAPVRKRFLKTPRSEYLAIESIVRRFALSAPHIALNLKHDDKMMLTLPAAENHVTRQLRVGKLLGNSFIEQAKFLDVERAGLHLQGWVSGCEYQRSQNDQQWIYINGRMVKDKLIQHALKQVYGELLHPGRHTACVLYLTVPLGEVDVNVHPAKHEVRFQQPRLVHDFIVSELTQALSVEHVPVAPIAHVAPHTSVEHHQLLVREPLIQSPLNLMEPGFSEESSNWVVLNAEFSLMTINSATVLVDVVELVRSQLRDYLVHAPRPLPSRPLLLPVAYSVKQPDFVERHQQALAQWGVVLDELSEGRVVVRAVPRQLAQLDMQKLLEQVSHEVGDVCWPDVLVHCQTIDARQIPDEEQQALTGFLAQALAQSPEALPGVVALTPARCRAMCYE